MKTLFMETTRIASERTVSEIQSVLMNHNCNSILLEYEQKQVSAVSFRIDVNGTLVPFRLPCRYGELETILKKSGKRPKSGDSYETWARRVGWRQILRWVEAQFALVETGMVKTEEVFLPYAQYPNGETVYERIGVQSKFLLETSV